MVTTAAQIVTDAFSAWLETTSFSGYVATGDQWDTEEAWPSPDTMNAARECFIVFHAGDREKAEKLMHGAIRRRRLLRGKEEVLRFRTGHRTGSWGQDVDEVQLRAILRTHSARRGAYAGWIWLSGPDYPGYAVCGIPDSLLAELIPMEQEDAPW